MNNVSGSFMVIQAAAINQTIVNKKIKRVNREKTEKHNFTKKLTIKKIILQNRLSIVKTR